MKTTRRRYWVFFLLFLFNLIAYVDRVNMSVAGRPIAQEFGLSPVALGYLFSSFQWAYVLMMLPGGRLIDRWGAHVMASVATAVWSAAQMAPGAASSFATMLVTWLGLGIGEAPFAPVTYRSVRAWAPYTERGTAIGAISAGSSLGLALGAPLVAWLIEVASWRWSFIITGAVGFVWAAIWLALVSTPEKTGWLPEAERQRIFAARDAGVEPPSHDGVGLSRANPLPGDVGPVRVTGLPRLFGLPLHDLAAQLSADRARPVANRVRHFHLDPFLRRLARQYHRQLVG
jgi:MFS family permease